ncbi:NAD(P)H-dependent oxidoreductase [Ancylobacter mangrovi]|uniref:Homoserine dehydrogenase n=1 Tax=Ancylobacter mangrovi TaxID=2972472 RepID=A0A9X2PAS1_9HYPH|nr:homoserine dehydrogenase [Ancylobacter mangrovi]MCS0495357.1 homoserine dehydrogenase [Ancylobacter mangrovi]MCS0503003.1 homoserine dehydrogenase [Ancylobacter mangrovi]
MLGAKGIVRSGIAAELEQWTAAHGPVTIGLAGAGQMGTDLIVQAALMPGVRIGAVTELNAQTAIDAALMAGHRREDVVSASSPSQIDRAIETGHIALTDDYRAMCAAGNIDVVIDATGSPNIGTLVSLEAIRNGKHVVLLSVEADITIGRFLKQEARSAGVVLTGAAGDEPAATIELIGFAQALGFEIVCAGKAKNNAFKPDAVPDEFAEEAKARNMNPRMLVEFVDGSKTMVEMTALANATGLVPDVPGMHGPAADREALAQVLCTREDGGILSRAGVVDYTLGKGVAPGVFCIVKPRHPRVLERMADLKVGPGPCFALIRPFHLTSLEVPLSAVRAVMSGRPDMEVLDHPVAECIAVAKRDLRPGDVLGRIGEYDYRGFCMGWRDARDGFALPLGLAEKARVLKPVRAGEQLTYDNCAPDEALLVTQIRRRLDQADAQYLAA